MTVFINLLVSLFISGCLGLFMLVLTAGSLMEQDKRFKALEEKIDKDHEALLKKIDKDYEKILRELK